MKTLDKIKYGMANIKADYDIFKNSKAYHNIKAVTDIAVATPMIPFAVAGYTTFHAFNYLFEGEEARLEREAKLKQARKEVYRDLFNSISKGFIEMFYVFLMASSKIAKLAFKPKEEQRDVFGAKIYETEEEKAIVRKAVKVKARAKRINKIRKNKKFQESIQKKQTEKTIPQTGIIKPAMAVKPQIEEVQEVKIKDKVKKESKPEIVIGVNTDNVSNDVLINRYLVKCDKFFSANINSLNEKDAKSVNYLKERLIDLNAHIEVYHDKSCENENLIKVVKYISKCTTGKDFVKISKNKKLINNIDFLKVEFNLLVIRDIRRQEHKKLQERNKEMDVKIRNRLTSTETIETMKVPQPKMKVIVIEDEQDKKIDYKELYEMEVAKNVKSNRNRQTRKLKPEVEKLKMK